MMIPANPLRRSIPTDMVSDWWGAGWAYVMPDFDNANHSIVEWLSEKAPVEPHCVPENIKEAAEG